MVPVRRAFVFGKGTLSSYITVRLRPHSRQLKQNLFYDAVLALDLRYGYTGFLGYPHDIGSCPGISLRWQMFE